MGNETSKPKKKEEKETDHIIDIINGIEIYDAKQFIKPISSSQENFLSNTNNMYAFNRNQKFQPQDYDIVINSLLSKIDIDSVKEFKTFKGTYIGRIIDVHDGDSLKAIIFNDFGQPIIVDIRLYGADAFEITKKTVKKRLGESEESFNHRDNIANFVKKLGLQAKAELLRFIGAEQMLDSSGLPPPNGKKTQDFFNKNYIKVNITVINDENRDKDDDNKCDKEKYGRLLAYISNEKGQLHSHLISKNLALPYYGKTKSQEEFAESLMGKMTDESERLR